MKRHLRAGCALVVLVGLGACSDGGLAPSRARSSQASLERGALTATLVRADGSAVMAPVDLLLADAWTTCGSTPEGQVRAVAVRDATLALVRLEMTRAYAEVGGAASVVDWRSMREQPNHNVAPLSGAPLPVGLRGAFPARYDLSRFTNVRGAPGAVQRLQRAMDVAALNLCMSRSLQEQMRMGTALLVPSSDQRRLLSEIRSRAQVAMLQLADLFVAMQMVAPQDGGLDEAVAVLREWVENGSGPNLESSEAVLREWALDLLEATKLQVNATQELGQRLLRSAGSGEPPPNRSAITAADDFRPGGWRQRALALFYGGDPLAGENPGIAPGATTGGGDQLGWPTRDEVPYADSASARWTGGAVRMLDLAQRLGTLSLTLRPGVLAYAEPEQISVLDTGARLYREAEAKLRTQSCHTVDTQVAQCHVWTPESVPSPRDDSPAALASYRLYTRHGVRPADAVSLAQAMVSVLPSTTRGGGFQLRGAITSAVDPDGRVSLRFGDDAGLMPRSLLEIASVFSRFGRHRVPTTLVAGDAHVEPLYTGLSDGGTGTVVDATRFMGAVPALAALRAALAVPSVPRNPASSALDAEKGGLLSFVHAAIGDSFVAVEPLEQRLQIDGATVVAQAGGDGLRRWSVRTKGSSNDPFWSGPTRDYTVVAVTNTARALTLLADPGAPKSGFGTMEDLLAATQAHEISRAGIVRDEVTGVVTAVVSVPEQTRAVFMVVRQRRGQLEVRALTGATSLWATASTTARGERIARPGDALYFAPGGLFADFAMRVWAVLPNRPTHPAFDGDGRPQGAFPDPLADNDDRSGQAYLSVHLREARDQAAIAHDRLRTALDLVRTTARSQGVVADAKARELVSLNATLTSLCGSDVGAVGPRDPSGASAATACGVQTATVEALGSTSDELAALCGVGGGQGAPASRPSVRFDAGSTVCALNTSGAARVKCLLDSLSGKLSFPVEVARPAACAQYGAPTGGTGALATVAARQQRALVGYRNSISELIAAGNLVLARASAADESVRLARAEVLAGESRAALARQQAYDQLAAYATATTLAKQRHQDAVKVYAEMNDLDVKDVARAGLGFAGAVGSAVVVASTATAVAAGAAAGSVVPGVGTVVGAAVAGLVSFVSSLFGPSETEIAAAQAQMTQTNMEARAAVEAEQRFARTLGFCTAQPCAPAARGTLADMYATQMTVERQTEVVTKLNAVVGVHEANLALRERLSRVASAAADLGATSIEWRNTLAEAELALGGARAEARIVQRRELADFGLTTRFHAYEMFDAVGDVERARVKALHARRALEFTFGIDLATLESRQGDVLAPALWANQVFDYDFRPIVVNGLTTVPRIDDGIQPLRSVVYAANLEDFRAGHLQASAQRSMTVGADATSFEGPAATLELVRPTPAGDELVVVPHPYAAQWSLSCPAGSSSEAGSNTCLTPEGVSVAPQQTKVRFSLDAWGHVTSGPQRVATPDLLNGRWHRFAVVLVGADIRNCEAVPPQDRVACREGLPRVAFRLENRGPFVVTNTLRELVPLAIKPFAGQGIGIVKNGIIDANAVGWNEPALANNVVPTFAMLPLEGAYELTLTPDVGQDLRRIERVQLVFQASFYESRQ